MAWQYDPAMQVFALERRERLPNGLISAIMYQESKGDEDAVSHTGVRGLMQITGETAEGLGIDRLDPGQSIEGGSRLLRTNADEIHECNERLQRRGRGLSFDILDANGNITPRGLELVAASWNAGGGAVRSAIRRGGDNWLAVIEPDDLDRREEIQTFTANVTDYYRDVTCHIAPSGSGQALGGVVTSAVTVDITTVSDTRDDDSRVEHRPSRWQRIRSWVGRRLGLGDGDDRPPHRQRRTEDDDVELVQLRAQAPVPLAPAPVLTQANYVVPVVQGTNGGGGPNGVRPDYDRILQRTSSLQRYVTEHIDDMEGGLVPNIHWALTHATMDRHIGSDAMTNGGRETVRAVQERLNQLGFGDDPRTRGVHETIRTNGVWNHETIAAWRRFQETQIEAGRAGIILDDSVTHDELRLILNVPRVVATSHSQTTI